MEGPNKKNRSANYTPREIELLITLAAKYKDIIENKKTDAVSMSEKNDAWKRICNEFNSIAPNLCFRSAESLKKLYENRKKELRKKVGEYKKELYLTGGGPPAVLTKSDTDDLLLDIVNGKTIFGLENRFDNDRENIELSKVSTPKASSQLINKSLSDYEELGAAEDYNSPISKGNNNIEVIFADSFTTQPIREIEDLNHMDEQSSSDVLQSKSENISKSNWAHYKASDLTKPVTEALKRKKDELQTPQKKRAKSVSSRRRPHSSIQTLSSSSLHEKYEKLVDKKLVSEDFKRQKSQLEMEFLREEHELKMKELALDIEIKKKQLEALNRQT